MIPTVAAINDLSGLGKCSLTAAIPVLSVMGVQPCPLPTAVLSAQTGFPGYALHDLTEDMGLFCTHWQQLGQHFDGIFTGFLSSCEQAAQIHRFLDLFAKDGVLVLTDPVMGDNGVPYPVCTPALQEQIAGLVRRAQVVTPNLTEACMLTGASYRAVSALEGRALLDAVTSLASAIAASGPKTVIITGVHSEGRIFNVTLHPGGRHLVGRPIHGGSYSGTGDLFASAVCGGLLRGLPVERAVTLATDFLSASLADTPQGDRNQGICFEPHLHMLWGAVS